MLAVVIVGTPAPSSASAYGDAAYVVDLTNGLRAWYGGAPLEADRSLQRVAATWAAELAWNGYLAHNPSLSYQVDGWWVLGENVGYGGSVEEVHAGWVNSYWHHANLVERSYSRIGVGVAYDGWGGLYIVQVFVG